MEKIYSVIFNNYCLFLLMFIVSVMLFCIAIMILKKMQYGQVVRDDGPETHLKKKGTPTMGGIVFIIVLIISELLFIIFKDYMNSIKELKITIFVIIFGFVGFIDDYLKVTKKNTKGLPSIFKFILQVLFAGLGLIICFNNNIVSNLLIFIFLIFVIVGTDNGVNFTDGLDGLCTAVTIVVSIFYIFVSYKIDSKSNLYLNEIVLAMLFAFLIFNHFPAKVFMGDTGSLLLGAYVAFMAIELNIYYFLPIYGFIYMIEVLSVIMQVSYFKITGGKRIFKMAPIHHHFEKCGFSENKIVIMFSLVTILLCVITYFII